MERLEGVGVLGLTGTPTVCRVRAFCKWWPFSCFMVWFKA